jgi:YbbR domain-containing protein
MLSPGDVSLPNGSGIEVSEILDPRMVEFDVDTVVERSVRVRVVLIGDLTEGLSLEGPIRAEPEEVQVRGPSRVLESLATIPTEAVDLSRLREPRELEVRLGASDPALEVVPASVRVNLPVVPLRTRTLSPIRVQVRNLARGLRARVAPDSAWIVVSGPELRVNDLQPESFLARVDAAGLGPGRHAVTPEVDLPDPVLKLLAIRPTRFVLEVEAGPGGEKRGNPR